MRWGCFLSLGGLAAPRVTGEAVWQSLEAGTASHVPVELTSHWAILPVTPQSVPATFHLSLPVTLQGTGAC